MRAFGLEADERRVCVRRVARRSVPAAARLLAAGDLRTTVQEKWSESNPTCGQCSITSFLVQDIFGGEVYGVPNGDGSFHCFNKVGDAVFDLTSEQFDHPIEYRLDFPQKRETHFAKTEKKSRYEALKGALIRMGESQ